MIPFGDAQMVPPVSNNTTNKETKMRTQITNYIRAGYPGIYLVSHEESRVEGELKAVAKALKYHLHAWSATQGLVDTESGSVKQADDPMEAVMAIGELPENSIILLRDFHLFLQDNNPVLVRAVKDELLASKAKGRCLVILGCRQVLPAELEREFVLLDFALPDKEQLGIVLDGICESAKLKKLKSDERDMVLDAATGLTSTEAENAFALAVIEAKRVDPGIVAREKAATVKKNGVLEIVTVKETLDSIGGLDVLKNWLIQRKDAFSQRAREYGLPSPKGLLIVGVPGTGKSLTAKATASILGRPLLKLDAGRLFGGLVGQSEANLRAALNTAEAIAPCVLWCDEIEKGFSGSKSSGSTDGGTSSRVFGGFISWMQERTKPVFVVATANDVTALPPEFLRKGRWDDLFFVDLPNQEEREAIWKIQVLKHGRDWSHYDAVALAKAADAFTGAEIEAAFADALYAAFAAGREPLMPDIVKAMTEAVPLSRLMGEQIAGLRKWAIGRCRMATAPIKEEKGRKIAA
jgi:SpoVK/Ycf46/Vps4 family AAA+-type ATPase